MGEAYTDRDRILCAAFFSVTPNQELQVGPTTRKIWPKATMAGIYHLVEIGVITEIGDHHYQGSKIARELAFEFMDFSEERKRAAQKTIIDRPTKDGESE